MNGDVLSKARMLELHPGLTHLIYSEDWLESNKILQDLGVMVRVSILPCGNIRVVLGASDHLTTINGNTLDRLNQGDSETISKVTKGITETVKLWL